MTCCRTWTSLSTSCFMSLQESVECRQTLSHIEILCRPVSEPAGHQVSRDTHKHTPPPALEDHRPGHGKASSLQSYRWDLEIIFHSHLLYQWLAKHTWTWTTYTLLSCNYSWTGEPVCLEALCFHKCALKSPNFISSPKKRRGGRASHSLCAHFPRSPSSASRSPLAPFFITSDPIC